MGLYCNPLSAWEEGVRNSVSHFSKKRVGPPLGGFFLGPHETGFSAVCIRSDRRATAAVPEDGGELEDVRAADRPHGGAVRLTPCVTHASWLS